MKICLKFHIFAPKIGQSKENALAMKILIEFHFLANSRTCKTLEIRQNPEIPLPMKIWHKFHIIAPKIGQNPENALAMKIRLEFRILAPPGAVNSWNPAKSRNSNADENLAQISHLSPKKFGQNQEKCTCDENSAPILHSCTFRTCKHLKSRQNPEIPLPMKIWLKFHMFAPKIRQNEKNVLAMKIRLEFRILAPPGAVNTWNPAKSRNSTADENLAQISHFCP